MQSNVNLVGIFLIMCVCFSCALEQTSKANAYNDKGIEYLDQGLYEEAIIEFKKAVDLVEDSNPNKKIYVRNIGNTFYSMGQIDSCIRYFNQALTYSDRNSFEYHINLGDVKLMEGDTRLGIKHIKMASRIDPENFEPYNLLGLIYMGEYGVEYYDLDKALENNKTSYEYEPSAVNQSVLARNYYYLEDYESAKEHYQALSDFAPDELEHKYYLGLTNYELEEYASAKELLDEVIQMDSAYLFDIEEVIEDLAEKVK